MQEFSEWVSHHATVFGLTAESDTRTLSAWLPVFSTGGHTVEDLFAVTDYLAAHPEALNREERFSGKLACHLAAILDRLKEIRAIVYQKDVKAHEHERGTCTLCSGSGYVIVPHPKAVHDGQWVPVKTARAGPSWYTAAVLCTCALGRWVGEHVKEEKRPMSLEYYTQAINPYWREHMAQRQASHLARAQLQEPDENLQKTFNRILEDIATRPGL